MAVDSPGDHGGGPSMPVPPPPSSPPKSQSPRNRKRVSGAIFNSFRSHLTGVRSAISHKTRSNQYPTIKEGDLYPWDGEQPSPSTPKIGTRKVISSVELPTMGTSGSSMAMPQPRQTSLEMPTMNSTDQSSLPLQQLDTTTDAVMGTSDTSTPSRSGKLSPKQALSMSQQKRRTFYMPMDSNSSASAVVPPASPGYSRAHSRQSRRSSAASTGQQQAQASAGGDALPATNSWSWSEQFFFSQDDEDITVGDSDISPHQNTTQNNSKVPGIQQDNSFPSIRPMNSVKFEPIMEHVPPPPDGDDDETCNNTIVEKARQRSKKASRASTVGAFVTFLKALFGIGMLSNPAVLGEVGLLLGTFCHLFIVVGCAFSCYLLLAARQMAKMEVLAKQRRDQEKREEYEMWRQEMENRAAMRAGRTPMSAPGPMMSGNYDMTNMYTPGNRELDRSENSRSQNTLQATNMGSSNGGDTEDWTVAPVPVQLNRVGTSMIPPKQGWKRCEAALNNANMDGTGHASPGRPIVTGSCGKVEMMKQSQTGSKRSLNISSQKSKSPRSSRKQLSAVTDEYQRFSDKVHNSYMMSPPPPEPPTPPPLNANQIRLVTYGDVAKYLAGRRASFFIIFTIVTVHLMFASGMVHLAVENLCYVIGWERLGWSYVEEYVEQDYRRERRLGPSEDESDYSASRSSDEEEYYLEWKGPDFIGRLAMASLLFPIIQGLLQIPSLTELATISTVGLVTYAFGCVGSMLYTALVLTDGHPFLDHPDDMWKTKWSGIPTYVATTIYCIEGINLALPTVSSIEGTQRWGAGVEMMRQRSSNLSGSSGGRDKPDLSVFIVVGAVFLYGMVTLVVSWIGLAGGLGGGIGTMHGEDGCWDVTYCLNSSAVRFVYMLSLGVALVLTLPVILYPSTEMLEVWLDERNDERRRKMDLAAMARKERKPEKEPFWQSQKSLLPDDETVCTVTSDTASPRTLGIRHPDIENREWSASSAGMTSNSSAGAGEYVAPNQPNSSTVGSPVQSPMSENESPTAVQSPPTRAGGENTKLKARRKLKYWKLRMFLAFIICVIGTIEGSFPSVLKAAEVIRGVGLSIAGLIFPPLLYMSAVGGNFSVPMAAAMALLIGLGLFNIILVLMSAFGSKDYIVEEGRGNFYEM